MVDSDLIIDTQEAADEHNDRVLALLGVTREDVLRELQYRQERKYREAKLRMAHAQRTAGERRAIRGREGDGGEVEMMIDPISYHYWGNRLGYECWDDKQFRAEYLRDNPESRIKSLSRICFTPSLAVQSRLKREQAHRAAVKARTLSSEPAGQLVTA